MSGLTNFLDNEPLDKIGRNAIGLKFGSEDVYDPGAVNRYGFGANSKTYATDTYAALTRDQWSTYVQDFVPYENKLIDYATDPNVVKNAMSTASTSVNNAFDARAAGTASRMKGLGLTLDADEQQASTRSLGLARGLADANAQNTSRDSTIALQQSILGNPTPKIGGLS